MRSGFRLGRVLSVELFVDWGLLVIFWLLTLNLGVWVFPAWHPEWGRWLSLGVAAAAALLFFASVLAHEMSHALVARAFGIPVRNITLFIFGGVADIQREPPSPKSELLIAIVGPLTSLALGGLFVLIGVASASATGLEGVDVIRRVGPVTTLLLWLGPVNILLGIFNLVPGFPLDGGRVLRAALWAATKNLRTATRWAARAGQAFAWLLIILGIGMLFGVHVPILGGGLIQGLWLVFLGWFLNSAAIMSYRGVVVGEVLQNVPVSRVMRADVAAVPPTLSVEDLVDRYIMGTDQHAFPVVEGDRLVGIVCLHDVRRIPQAAWRITSVRDVMTAEDDLTTVRPEEDAAAAFRKLTGRDVDQVPVVEDGRLRGILRRRDIMRWLELQPGEATT